MQYRRLGGALAASALIVVSLALAPSAAQAAGMYTVHQCQTLSGKPGPLDTATSFKFDVRPPGAAANTCGQANGAFTLALNQGASWSGSTGASAIFTAPTATNVAAVAYARTMTGFPSGLSYRAIAGKGSPYAPSEQVNFEICTRDTQPCQNQSGNKGPLDAKGSQFVFLEVGCERALTNCTPPGVAVGFPRLTIWLADNKAPVASPERGSLFSSGSVDATRDAEFTTSDEGGGVYRVITRIDGKIPGAGIVRQGAVRTLATTKSTCVDADPSNGDLFEFWSAAPCPAGQNVTITDAIDTTKLTDGAHSIQFEVQDAAGNTTLVPGQARPFRVQNVKPNGVGADRKAKISMYFAKNRKDRMTTRNGIRVVTRGRLRDRKGRGIRSAEIDVYHFVRGKPSLLKTGLKSRKLGRLTLILPNDIYGDPKTGLRTLRYSYTAFRRPKGQKQERPTTRKTLKIKVLDKYGKPIIPKKYRKDAKTKTKK